MCLRIGCGRGNLWVDVFSWRLWRLLLFSSSCFEISFPPHLFLLSSPFLDIPFSTPFCLGISFSDTVRSWQCLSFGMSIPAHPFFLSARSPITFSWGLVALKPLPLHICFSSHLFFISSSLFLEVSLSLSPSLHLFLVSLDNVSAWHVFPMTLPWIALTQQFTASWASKTRSPCKRREKKGFEAFLEGILQGNSNRQDRKKKTLRWYPQQQQLSILIILRWQLYAQPPRDVSQHARSKGGQESTECKWKNWCQLFTWIPSPLCQSCH